MGKTRGLFAFCFLLFVLAMPFFIAEGNISTDTTDSSTSDSSSQTDKAYTCLENKVKNRCTSLSTEEKIFSVLALDECKDELVSDSKNSKECWPKTGCTIKTTAQAILALNRFDVDVSKAKNWLLAQNSTPNDVIWYLQIESPEQTTCTITYDSSSHPVNIELNKKISSSAGNCLSLSDNGYWLIVTPSCYSKEFRISCNKQFITSLLYKKQDSSTIFVSEKTSSAPSEGTTTEKINSLCFAQSGSCNYEGSLWATMVLSSVNEDVSSYIPYLTTLSSDNSKSLPNAFLYMLTSYVDFKTNLLSNQKTDGYWDESGEKFYDTALALYSLQNDESERIKAIEWLLAVQDTDGCWKGNIRDTAFILYAVWPKTFIEDGELDCEDSGYSCMSKLSCEGNEGNVLDDYSCAGTFRCCDKDKPLETCSKQGGEICIQGEDCSRGTISEASDTETGETCCVDGTCKKIEIVKESECELGGGICRSVCADNEESSSSDCDSSSKTCCVEKVQGKSYWWIWLLVILIILVIVGIIFRDKLRRFWFRIKSGSGKTGPGPPPPGPLTGMSQMPSSRVPMMGPPRRIFPPLINKSPMQKRPVSSSRKSTEIDDVLKKLKEIGK